MIDGVGIDGAVGANVRAMRISGGMSQGELAARMTTLGTDWTASHVSLIEAGKRKLTPTALTDLCRVFGVPVTVFFFAHPDRTGVVAERLAAASADQVPVAPTVLPSEEAEALRRQRVAARVLDRIVAAITWPLGQDDIEDRRTVVLDLIEERYDTRDLIEVRDALAGDRWNSPGAPTLGELGALRAHATRQLIDELQSELYHPADAEAETPF